MGWVTLGTNLGTHTGVMGLDPTFKSGYVNQTGYPDKYGKKLMNDYGLAADHGVDGYTKLDNFETWPGNSGGPVWHTVNGKNYVVGLVSTAYLDTAGKHYGQGAAAYDVANHYYDTMKWIATNDNYMIM